MNRAPLLDVVVPAALPVAVAAFAIPGSWSFIGIAYASWIALLGLGAIGFLRGLRRVRADGPRRPGLALASAAVAVTAMCGAATWADSHHVCWQCGAARRYWTQWRFPIMSETQPTPLTERVLRHRSRVFRFANNDLFLRLERDVPLLAEPGQ